MKDYKVLIIQDVTSNSNDLEEALLPFNYKVMVITRKTTKLRRKIQDFTADVILLNSLKAQPLDLMNWYKQLILDDLPCIVCSDEQEMNSIEKFSGLQTCGFFIKPSSILNLHLLIQVSMQKHLKIKEDSESLDSIKQDNENLRKLIFGKEVAQNPKVQIGKDLYFDTKNCETFYKKKRLSLTRKENMLIQLLVSMLELAVSFEQIIKHIWGKEHAIENNVRTLVWRLRGKLNQDVILTVSGIGYYINRYSSTEHEMHAKYLRYNKELKYSA